jgi:hypothetical protein
MLLMLANQERGDAPGQLLTQAFPTFMKVLGEDLWRTAQQLRRVYLNAPLSNTTRRGLGSVNRWPYEGDDVCRPVPRTTQLQVVVQDA